MSESYHIYKLIKSKIDKQKTIYQFIVSFKPPPPSDRQYWTQQTRQLNYLDTDMNRLSPSDPKYQELDRQRLQIMDEAGAAGGHLPDYYKYT